MSQPYERTVLNTIDKIQSHCEKAANYLDAIDFDKLKIALSDAPELFDDIVNLQKMIDNQIELVKDIRSTI